MWMNFYPLLSDIMSIESELISIPSHLEFSSGAIVAFMEPVKVSITY